MLLILTADSSLCFATQLICTIPLQCVQGKLACYAHTITEKKNIWSVYYTTVSIITAQKSQFKSLLREHKRPIQSMTMTFHLVLSCIIHWRCLDQIQIH